MREPGRFQKQKTVHKSEAELEALSPSMVLLHICSPSSVGTADAKTNGTPFLPTKIFSSSRERERDVRDWDACLHGLPWELRVTEGLQKVLYLSPPRRAGGEGGDNAGVKQLE